MLVVRHAADLPRELIADGSAVTIGSFDGMHLGHQRLLDGLLHLARAARLPSVVMSFEPTPEEFLSPQRPPGRLMRFREKHRALAQAGVNIFYCPRFDGETRGVNAVDFIRQVLIQDLNARMIAVGDGFRFAKRREGTVEHLRRVQHTLGFELHEFPSVHVAETRVSSSAVRYALRNHDLDVASQLLGRPYQMVGRVVLGRQVGRTLGFPTANVELKRLLSPINGIFAVRVAGLAESEIDGVASIGTRPTFDLEKPLLEVHLFDFDREIYGEVIRVDFVQYLREEIKFDSIEELVAQMDKDVENARRALANYKANSLGTHFG